MNQEENSRVSPDGQDRREPSTETHESVQIEPGLLRALIQAAGADEATGPVKLTAKAVEGTPSERRRYFSIHVESRSHDGHGSPITMGASQTFKQPTRRPEAVPEWCSRVAARTLLEVLCTLETHHTNARTTIQLTPTPRRSTTATDRGLVIETTDSAKNARTVVTLDAQQQHDPHPTTRRNDLAQETGSTPIRGTLQTLCSLITALQSVLPRREPFAIGVPWITTLTGPNRHGAWRAAGRRSETGGQISVPAPPMTGGPTTIEARPRIIEALARAANYSKHGYIAWADAETAAKEPEQTGAEFTLSTHRTGQTLVHRLEASGHPEPRAFPAAVVEWEMPATPTPIDDKPEQAAQPIATVRTNALAGALATATSNRTGGPSTVRITIDKDCLTITSRHSESRVAATRKSNSSATGIVQIDVPEDAAEDLMKCPAASRPRTWARSTISIEATKTGARRLTARSRVDDAETFVMTLTEASP